MEKINFSKCANSIRIWDVIQLLVSWNDFFYSVFLRVCCFEYKRKNLKSRDWLKADKQEGATKFNNDKGQQLKWLPPTKIQAVITAYTSLCLQPESRRRSSAECYQVGSKMTKLKNPQVKFCWATRSLYSNRMFASATVFYIICALQDYLCNSAYTRKFRVVVLWLKLRLIKVGFALLKWPLQEVIGATLTGCGSF